MNYAEIEEKIGYVFADKTLLKKAFTLSSYANAHGVESNERLEFLGDAVMETVVSEWLYKQTSASEGEMTNRRKELVCDEHLTAITENLGLKRFLLYVGGETDNLGKKAVPSLMEAIVAAVFEDGGYERAKEFVQRHIISTESKLKRTENADYISALKEFLEKDGKTLTKEDWAVKTVGKDNQPEHTVTLTLDGQAFSGTGMRIAQAKQSAAKKALENLKK